MLRRNVKALSISVWVVVFFQVHFVLRTFGQFIGYWVEGTWSFNDWRMDHFFYLGRLAIIFLVLGGVIVYCNRRNDGDYTGSEIAGVLGRTLVVYALVSLIGMVISLPDFLQNLGGGDLYYRSQYIRYSVIEMAIALIELTIGWLMLWRSEVVHRRMGSLGV